MSQGYVYADIKPRLFQEDGVKMLLSITKKATALCEIAGAVSMDKLMCIGESWTCLAAMDYLCELGEFVEVTKSGDCWGQNRIFRKVRSEA